jgi:2-dehydro-3-deoxygalactonokinase
LRLVDTSDYNIIAELQSSEGVASTFAAWQKDGSTDRFEFYASRLRAAMQQLGENSAIELAGIPVIVSGMASSTIGMQEISYAPLPFSVDGSGVSSRIINDFNGRGAPLVLVSGVRSDDDVMRGEEAQLIGLINLDEISSIGQADSIFVFPGTHSKHMLVKQGKLVSFQTFMTGELFNILSEHSILKDSITIGKDFNDPANNSAFIGGVEASGFSNLLNSLFTVRTNQLFSKFSKEQNAFYLSGLLIGTELKQLVDDISVALVFCCGRNLFDHYKSAAGALSLTENITFIEPGLIDKATIAGQVQIFKASIN